MSKFNKNIKEIKRKKSKIKNTNNINENNNNKNDNKKNDNTKYNKTLKIKKGKAINPEEIENTSYISEKKLKYLNKTVRKIIYNRFVHNIFLFIEKGKENTFKIYSISDNNKNAKTVEIVILNPIFNV